jgi:hypothetical protein
MFDVVGNSKLMCCLSQPPWFIHPSNSWQRVIFIWDKCNLCNNAFQFVLMYAVRNVQEKKERTLLNGTRYLLVHADNVNLLGENKYQTERHIISTRC